MYKPKYKFTSQLLTNLSKIERFYGQLEGLRIPKKLELNLTERNLVQSAYVSNSIEGNPLSQREVTNLLLGDRVPVNRDEKEVQNYFDILVSLSSKIEEPINEKMVLDVHKQLLTGVEDKIAGQVRDAKVVIGKYTGEEGNVSIQVKHEPPAHNKTEIRDQMDDLYEWVQNSDDPIPLKAGIFHHQFVYIHPFSDGNGRTCRLLTALLFLKGGYSINKYFVLDDYYDIDRFMYSDKLHTADFGDKTEWLEYFTEGVAYSLQSALEKAKSTSEVLNISERLSERESEVLEILRGRGEITTPTLVDILGVSRQQAHSLLKALVDKGFLDKKGTTKASYYVLK